MSADDSTSLRATLADWVEKRPGQPIPMDAQGLLDLVDMLLAAVPIIRDITDPGECWFDHHGGCQEHGFLSLEPGETCPHADAKQWMEAHE